MRQLCVQHRCAIVQSNHNNSVKLVVAYSLRSVRSCPLTHAKYVYDSERAAPKGLCSPQYTPIDAAVTNIAS
eukprot:8148-Heterococcus_DN1.PRE.7